MINQEEIEKSKWLTSETEVASASINSLIRSLLTSDGGGKSFKAKCLNELLLRSESNSIIKE